LLQNFTVVFYKGLGSIIFKNLNHCKSYQNSQATILFETLTHDMSYVNLINPQLLTKSITTGGGNGVTVKIKVP
jgi:hypothetical protein